MTIDVTGAAHARPRSTRHRRGGSAAPPRPSAGPSEHWRRLVPLVRPYLGALAAASVASVVGAVLAVAQPLVVQRLIDALGTGRPLTTTVLVLVGLTLGEAGLAALQALLLQSTAEGVVRDLRVRFAAHVLRLPMATYDRRPAGDLVSRLTADTTLVRGAVTSGVVTVLSTAVTLVGVVAAMLWLDAVLFAFTVAAVAMGTVVVVRLSMTMRTATLRAQESVGAMAAGLHAPLAAVSVVRATRTEDEATTRVTEAADEARRSGLRLARLAAVVQPIMSVALQVAFISVLVIGGWRMSAGALSLGELLAFLLYMFLMAVPVLQTVGAVSQFQAAMGAVDRLWEILSLPPEQAAPTQVRLSTPVPRSTIAAAREEQVPVGQEQVPTVRFSRVCFAYPGGPEVLHDISFDVRPTTTTALVGPSGAGKSTVLHLLERFHEPTSGRIELAGTDVRRLSHSRVRGQLALVDQDAAVVSSDLVTQVTLGRQGASTDHVVRVLRRVGLRDLADALLDDGEVNIGEQGRHLSGGQRQRLAWARVLLGREAVVLLDEPTSAVDARTEGLLQQTLDEALSRRTIVVVAHRLSTVIRADHIVVLDAGRVCGRGTHAELLEQNDLYRDLAGRQLLT